MIHIELETTINKPVEAVFDRLADIPGYNDWMSKSGLFRESEQTSEGPPGEGTTFTDRVRRGKSVGEISDFRRPDRIAFRQTVYYLGMKLMESRPEYILEKRNGKTRVRHIAEGELYGLFGYLEAIVKKIALAERKRTLNALKNSFKNHSK